VGGTCPHAGGPLAEGVRQNDQVICPWHKAPSACAPVHSWIHPRWTHCLASRHALRKAAYG
jgi:hypothetical protein